MKTRIKIVELNGGDKKFICQKHSKELSRTFTSLMLSLVIFYLYIGLGFVMLRRCSSAEIFLPVFVVFLVTAFINKYLMWETIDQTNRAITRTWARFNTLEEAQKFLDAYRQEIVNKDYEKYKKKTKKTRFIKYPEFQE